MLEPFAFGVKHRVKHFMDQAEKLGADN